MWGWGQWLGGCRTCGSPTLGGWTLQYQLSISLKCSCLGIVWPAKCGMAVARWRDGHSFKCWELKVLIFCFCTKSCVFFLENRIAYLGPALSLFFFPYRCLHVGTQLRQAPVPAAPPAPGRFMALGPVASGHQVLPWCGVRGGLRHRRVHSTAGNRVCPRRLILLRPPLRVPCSFFFFFSNRCSLPCNERVQIWQRFFFGPPRCSAHQCEVQELQERS